MTVADCIAAAERALAADLAERRHDRVTTWCELIRRRASLTTPPATVPGRASAGGVIRAAGSEDRPPHGPMRSTASNGSPPLSTSPMPPAVCMPPAAAAGGFRGVEHTG